MKRLFRTSKPTIDPLPPPASVPLATEYDPSQQQSPPPQTSTSQQAPRKSASGLRLDAQSHPPPDAGVAAGGPAGQGGGMGAIGKSWFGGSSAPSVTPFPSDLGHGNPSSGGGGLLGGPMRRLSRREKRDKGGGSAPSMLEIQQLQMSAPPKQQQLPPPPPPGPKQDGQMYSSLPPPPVQSRFYEPELASPDSSWTVLPAPPGNRQAYDPGAESYGSRTHTPPLPIPSAPAMRGNGGSGRSSPTQQQLYLPPGARPPTPPVALRPGTPNYAGQLGQSQSSLHSQPYGDDLASGRAGRDRGYSSASSMRGSDVESGNGHPMPNKTSKIAQSQPIRSPLAYASSPPPPSAAFPTPQPHPFQMPPGGKGPSPYSPLEDDMRQLGLADQPHLYPQQPSPTPAPQQASGGKDKEKKKFWGMDMGWAGRREKEKGRDKENLDVRDPRDGGRRSFDWSQAQDHSIGQTGYHVTQNPPYQTHPVEEEPRGRLAGRIQDQRDKQDPANAKDVAAAIQMLCANPDPSFSAVYAVCDRMNHSDASETICKDAARALRKQFKNGNEGERKAAAVVWLLMMRNVPAVRPHAANKKVLQTLEPILLAPQNKPLVNVYTHRTITDILADLTFNFGHEKGCEALTDLWKKVKMPQEADGGRPLADDHNIFTPEAQYPTHFPDHPQEMYGYNNYPNGDYRPSEDRPSGPGYANLPSHGDDMRRLIEESTAGKEAARVLGEALVYTRPDEMGEKSIIREFYHKCFHAHESLTNQMDWAQAEASRSRERTMNNSLSLDSHGEDRAGNTIEEEALAALFEAHAALSEVIKQHDELERMAMEQKEISEVRERSKKDMRMGRDDPSRYEQGVTGFLSANQAAQGSTSRSPSPANPHRLGSSPAQNLSLAPFSAERSRTPSPDSLPLPPRVSSSPGRPASPLGRARGGRPLPNPYRAGTASNASLQSSSAGHGGLAVSNPDPARNGAGEEDDEDMPSVPLKPSRKALGKRPAKPVDPDDTFDPNDMFSEKRDNITTDRKDDSSSDESVTADDVFFHKPITYAYDAYKEKLDREAASGASSSASSYRASAVPVLRAFDGSGGSGASGAGTRNAYGPGAAQVDARA